jgi:histidyl-tRNA synthetase
MLQAPKGTHDIYGTEAKLWRKVEDEIRALTDLYGYGEIRTPLFEATELYLRGVGETTDIVHKEMYTFEDKGKRSMSLRPELTAGVARAFIERGMFNAPQPTKLFYIGPCFRYETPQAGRYRQHYQFGVEIFGAASPAAEAEIISLGHKLLTRLGIEGVRLHINSIGCADCRVAYNTKLRGFLQERTAKLCMLCILRTEKNPLRVLDCKNGKCQALLTDAPTMAGERCGDCEGHFTTLQTLLTRLGVPYVADPGVVRGLDYYTRTVFEFIRYVNGKPEQTVIGGGRYDGLISQLGGAAAPAVGFGMGLERLMLLLPKELDVKSPAVFIGHADGEGFISACDIVDKLRGKGILATNDLANRSVKAQMKYADKINARYTAILGATELADGVCNIKNMQNGETTRISVSVDGFSGFLADFA